MTDDRTAIAVISEISGVQNNLNHLIRLGKSKEELVLSS